MNVFMIEYNGGSISGTAFVASDTINNAISYLKNNGYFNGTPQVYQVVRIQRITATDMQPCIVSEIYKNPAKIAEKVSKLKSCTPSVRTEIKYVRCPSEKPDKPEKPEDITMESIIENNTSKILYIDRIGNLKRGLQPRNKGYLFMCSHNKSDLSNIVLGHLYLWDGYQYIDLGAVKSKYIKEVRSASAVIDVVRAESQIWHNNSSMEDLNSAALYFQEPSWYNPVGKIRTGVFFTGRNSRVPRLYRMLNNPGRYRRVFKEFAQDLERFFTDKPLLYEDNSEEGNFVCKESFGRPLIGISNLRKSESTGYLTATLTTKFFIGTYNKQPRNISGNKHIFGDALVSILCDNRRYQIRQIYKTFYVKFDYSQSSNRKDIHVRLRSTYLR